MCEPAHITSGETSDEDRGMLVLVTFKRQARNGVGSCLTYADFGGEGSFASNARHTCCSGGGLHASFRR